MFVVLVACSSVDDDPPIETDLQTRTETFDLGPINSFLRTSPDDMEPEPPVVIELALRDIEPGDVLTLSVDGRFYDDAQLDESDYTIGVFSGSDTLLDWTNPHRIPDAIDAGVDWETSRTYYGDLPTDIPEDFRLDGSEDVAGGFVAEVEVPEGATHLFAGVGDSTIGDNSSSDEGFRVVMTYY